MTVTHMIIIHRLPSFLTPFGHILVMTSQYTAHTIMEARDYEVCGW